MPKTVTHKPVWYLLLLLVTAAMSTACGLSSGDANPASPNEPPQAPDTAATVATAVSQTATAAESSTPQSTPDYRATIQAALPADPPTPAPTATPNKEYRGQQYPPTDATSGHATRTPAPDPAADDPAPTATSTHIAEFDRSQRLRENNPQTAKAIHFLPWIYDGVSPEETAAVQVLIDLASDHPQPITDLTRQPWIRDGITATERSVIHRIFDAGTDTATNIISLPWLHDGIDPEEHETLSFILRTSEQNPELAHALLALRWFYGGLQSHEKPALESFQTISRTDPEAAARIAKMPFLKTLEPADVNALRSLSRLAHDTPGGLRRIMAHPELPDPLEDRHTDILTVLHGLNIGDTELIGALLGHHRVKVERRTIKTATTGSIRLAIVRTREGAERSLDLLEHAVRSAEHFVNRPFPNRHVVLLFAEGNEPVHHGTHITIPAAYDVNDGSPTADRAPRIIAEQIAGYYWNGNSPWVDRGIAGFLASVSERARAGAPVTATTAPCPVADSISELTQITPPNPRQARACRHALGERFWLSLYQNAGEKEFRKGVQQLHRIATETAVGIEQITQAFRHTDTAADISADRWYNGSFYQRFSPDPPQGAGELHSIDGFIDHIYLAVGEQGDPISEIPAAGTSEALYLVLEYSYHIVDGPYALDLSISVSYEDGFVFQRKQNPITVREGSHRRLYTLPVGNPPGQPWARGRYWVDVFDGPHKVAQAELTVTGRH